jgi:hypothetical protein
MIGKEGQLQKTEPVEVLPFLEVEVTISADAGLSGFIEGNEVADAIASSAVDSVFVGDNTPNLLYQRLFNL